MRVALGIVLSLALGFGSALLAVRGGLAAGDVRVGPWRTNLTIGSADADLYTRARVAVAGLLALAPSETIYFTAATDSEGEPLRASCDYVLAGGELPARWWSITAYGADHFLIPNAAGRYSIGQTTLMREADGRWTARVSSQPSDRNWIPSGDAGASGELSLTLRLYNPHAEVARDPASAQLPDLTRESCR
ncbi:MAG TPA: DUF1214 domain-containing protein [Myxococcota bacterium]|nr:DUF1214 domain-containing protein [Myxococcota bacterium]